MISVAELKSVKDESKPSFTVISEAKEEQENAQEVDWVTTIQKQI